MQFVMVLMRTLLTRTCRNEKALQNIQTTKNNVCYSLSSTRICSTSEKSIQVAPQQLYFDAGTRSFFPLKTTAVYLSSTAWPKL